MSCQVKFTPACETAMRALTRIKQVRSCSRPQRQSLLQEPSFPGRAVVRRLGYSTSLATLLFPRFRSVPKQEWVYSDDEKRAKANPQQT